MTGDLVAFLNARIEDAEARARYRLADGSQYGAFEIDPEWVLRDVEAKRKILAEHGHELIEFVYANTLQGPDYGCRICANDDGVVFPDGWCPTLRALAAVYSDHPDYRPDWD